MAKLLKKRRLPSRTETALPKRKKSAPAGGVPAAPRKDPTPPVLKKYLQRGLTGDSMHKYLAEIGSIPLLTAEEEKDLGRRIAKGDQEALQTLVERNLRFVVVLAKKYRPYGSTIPLADLINEGNLGLIEAAQRFDAGRDVRFITYAMWWIRQAILHALAEYERPLKLPAKKATLSHHIARTAKELRFEQQRDPTLREIAEKMGLQPEDINDVYALREESLDAVMDDESGMTRMDIMRQDTEPSAEEILLKELLITHVGEILAQLTPREEEVLRLRFGIDEGEPMTLDDIGLKIRMSRERVRQIEKSALNKLRRSRLTQQLKGYLN